MTSFIAWIGRDQREVSSLYFASDSRISWPGLSHWDYGKKVFACHKSAHIFAYVGDVLFPSLALAQIAPMVDAGALFQTDASPESQFSAVQQAFEECFQHFPANRRQEFTIAFGLRIGELMASTFHVFTLAWTVSRGWSGKALALPEESGPLEIIGSGAHEVQKWHTRWEGTTEGGTSRAVFSAFCDALRRGADPKSGGPPQVAAIYRKGAARTIGIVSSGQQFVLGLPAHSAMSASPQFEWRNEKFERCGHDGLLLATAKEHRAPKGLGP